MTRPDVIGPSASSSSSVSSSRPVAAAETRVNPVTARTISLPRLYAPGLCGEKMSGVGPVWCSHDSWSDQVSPGTCMPLRSPAIELSRSAIRFFDAPAVEPRLKTRLMTVRPSLFSQPIFRPRESSSSTELARWIESVRASE